MRLGWNYNQKPDITPQLFFFIIYTRYLFLSEDATATADWRQHQCASLKNYPPLAKRSWAMRGGTVRMSSAYKKGILENSITGILFLFHY